MAVILAFCLNFFYPLPAFSQEGDSIVILPSQIELFPSSEEKVNIIVLGNPDQGKKVKFSVKQVPPNIFLSFDPEEIPVPGITRLTIKASPEYIPANILLEVTCDFGDQIKFGVINLKAKKALEVRLPNPEIFLFPGEQADIGVYIYHLKGSEGLNFQLENLPQGLKGSFSPFSKIDQFSSTSTLVLNSLPDIKPGSYQSLLVVSDGLSQEKVSIKISVLFPDIKNHWARKEIGFLVSQGTLSGYPDGTFLPDNTITRAELAKILSVSFDIKMVKEGGASFKDVDPNFWATPYIERLYKGGIIQGYPDGTFRPQDPVKRSELASMIARMLHWTLVPQNFPPTFLDLSPNHWAFQYIETGTWQGVWDGYPDGNFLPEKGATRAEISVLISRLLSEP
ncbi:MAG: S-layer homology domain-containing protein [Caldiserica bacterium]|nr:S-layer homology domain-containing protein [Caldisericota bacterium]MDH7563081.1 S-layer homology domain-containing protein [Caldisericota bacterium]